MRAVLMLILTSIPGVAQAYSDCQRANNLRFIDVGKSEGEMIAKAGPPDLVSGGGVIRGYGGYASEVVIYTYFPLCNNQTRYTFKVIGGVVTDVQNDVQR